MYYISLHFQGKCYNKRVNANNIFIGHKIVLAISTTVGSKCGCVDFTSDLLDTVNKKLKTSCWYAKIERIYGRTRTVCCQRDFVSYIVCMYVSSVLYILSMSIKAYKNCVLKRDRVVWESRREGGNNKFDILQSIWIRGVAGKSLALVVVVVVLTRTL